MKGWGRGSWLWWRIAQIRPNSPTQGRLAKRCRARCINLPNCYQFPAKPVASAGIWTFHQIFSDLRAELESCVRAKWLALNFLACVFVAENVAQSREEEGMSWGTLGLIYYVFQAGRYNAVRCRYITCSLKLPLLQECSPTLVEGEGSHCFFLARTQYTHVLDSIVFWSNIVMSPSEKNPDPFSSYCIFQTWSTDGISDYLTSIFPKTLESDF